MEGGVDITVWNMNEFKILKRWLNLNVLTMKTFEPNKRRQNQTLFVGVISSLHC